MFPHFDDQHSNAVCLEKAGCGPILCNIERLSADLKKRVTYENPMFDAAHVTAVVKNAFENPSFKKNI